MEQLSAQMEKQWERDTANIYGDTTSGIGWGNLAPMGMSMFPREWAVAMAESWLNNSEYGFLTPVGLSCKAIGNWSSTPELDDYHFGVTPDANWSMLRGLYRHAVDTLANKFTLTHLKGYHLER